MTRSKKRDNRGKDAQPAGEDGAGGAWAGACRPRKPGRPEGIGPGWQGDARGSCHKKQEASGKEKE